MKKEVKGHINCPYCDGAETMRVIEDKNGKPFGHCDDCNGQMRVGGNSYREKKFYSLHPWAAPKAPEIPVTVTEQKPAAKAEPVAPVIPVTVSEPVAPVTVKARTSFDDALAIFGVKK